MPSVLKDKIAGMSDQQAEKLSRELQVFSEVFKHPDVKVADFPLLTWLCKAIKLEGTVAEQIHLCPNCRKNNHEKHSYDYKDIDRKVWLCRCTKCAGWLNKPKEAK